MQSNDPDDIATLLVEAGQAPTMLAVEQEDLEHYFLRLVGQMKSRSEPHRMKNDNMNNVTQATWVELFKARRSKMPLLTGLGFLDDPICGRLLHGRAQGSGTWRDRSA